MSEIKIKAVMSHDERFMLIIDGENFNFYPQREPRLWKVEEGKIETPYFSSDLLRRVENKIEAWRGDEDLVKSERRYIREIDEVSPSLAFVVRGWLSEGSTGEEIAEMLGRASEIKIKDDEDE